MRLTVMCILFLFLGLPAVSRAQAPAPAYGPESDFSTDQGQVSNDQAVPTPLTSFVQSLAFSPELARSNYLNGGITVRSTYDDNALDTSTGQIGNLGNSVLPYIGLRESISRLQLGFNYAGGFTINQRLSPQNQGTQTAGLDFRYRLAPHVDVRVRDNFFMTTGFLNQLSQGILPTPPGGPNQTVITPLANEKSDNVTGEITYQFSAGNVVGAGGTFYFMNYSDVSGGSQLQNSRSEQAMAFYNHRVHRNNWLGVHYSAENLTFSPSSATTFVHSIQGTFTMMLRPTIKLTVFGGAEFSDTSTLIFMIIPVSYRQVTPTEGTNFSWNGERTSATANFSHMVSGGGGFQTAVQFSSGQGAIRRQFTRRTGMELNFGYSTNDPLTPNSGISSYQTFSGGVSVQQQLANRLSLTVGYARDYQQQSVTATPTTSENHNRAWVSLSYGFERPIGR